MKNSRISAIKNIINNRKGYSSVFLAVCFVGFSVSLVAAVWICRSITVRSECESYGRVWARAVLSEYDVHLMEDYGIMAYFGGESEVKKKIDSYMNYSLKGKLSAKLGGSQSELAGYELGDPGNFRKAIAKNLPYELSEMGVRLLAERRIRSSATEDDADENNEGSGGDHVIGNRVVLDTLPSNGHSSWYGSSDIERIADTLKNIGSAEGVRSAVIESTAEMVFIEQYFGNHVTRSNERSGYLENEWEYIIMGNPSDKKNFQYCRLVLIAVRESMNAVSIAADSKKRELIAAVAKSAGYAGPVVAVVLPVVWAGIETVFDMRDLYKGGRVPVIKNSEQWKTDLGSILESDRFKKETSEKLDDEGKEALEEGSEDMKETAQQSHPGSSLDIPWKDGLNYDEYLLVLIKLMGGNLRTRRIMDLVQINMKSRYYRDFNMMEYYTGVRYVMEVNGRHYEFEDAYK